MNFLFPYWLLAASAILIPIAIHLWNKRQGKTVKIGSLRWLDASASSKWSSIRLSQVWLLLLRCTIIVLLAVALATPYLLRNEVLKKGEKAVFISQELLYSREINKLKPTVDSLLRNGYTLHRYNPEFSFLSQEQWQELTNKPKDSVTRAGNHWGLIAALNQRFTSPQDSVWLFTSDQQRHFSGTRPAALPENITWIPVTLEAPFAWIQTATVTGADSLQVVVGTSKPDHTSFSRYKVAVPALNQEITVDKDLKIKLQKKEDRLWVALHDTNPEQWGPVLQQPLKIAFYADKENEAEVPYLLAAIKAISTYTGIPVSLKQPAAPDTTVAVTFWLKKEEVPEVITDQVRRQGKLLWIQAGSAPQDATPSTFSVTGSVLTINRLRPAATGNKAVLWETNKGEPLLTEQVSGKGKVYEFNSGFTPEWSALGQSLSLPELLLPVLMPQPFPEKFNRHTLEEHQLRPPTRAAVSPDQAPAQRKPLSVWFIVAALCLFVVERLYANRKVSKAR